ncbi:MAG: hypothetical protein K6F55_00835 [Eubacterium sp.]|nr:hypothetical protein [Eubacterium sp.]
MGYNFFKIKQVPEVFNNKLNEFCASIGTAISKGVNIPFADSDVSYVLKLQNDRLRRKCVDLEYNIYARDPSDKTFNVGSEWRDAHYYSAVCNNRCGVKRIVRRGGNVSYRDDKRTIMYGTITDVLNGIRLDNDPYGCPNCGAVSTVAGLQNGCSYCGTRFRMDELFPKITSYYFLEEPGMTSKEFKTGFFKLYPIAAIAMYILCCIIKPDVYLPWNLVRHVSTLIWMIIGIGLGSFPVAYILYVYFLFMRLIVKAIANTGKMGTAGSRSMFESRMKRISPEFSYEYFTSKALSLIKTAVFSQNESELMFYEGGPLDPKMKDIIDLNYGGALGIKSFVDEGQYATVVTKAYFDVIYATDSKVYSKSQVFSATFRRRTDIPVNFNFSITRITCPSCGASFDATKIKNCPYCGNQYDGTSDDWVLVELKYN